MGNKKTDLAIEKLWLCEVLGKLASKEANDMVYRMVWLEELRKTLIKIGTLPLLNPANNLQVKP